MKRAAKQTANALVMAARLYCELAVSAFSILNHRESAEV